jgi:para-aminobenzoate synthetase component I
VKNSVQFPIKDLIDFKTRMLNWANQFGIFCFLDNNNYAPGNSFPCILAAGSNATIKLKAGSAYPDLRKFHEENPGWLFGHFGYDLKNETEHLSSEHTDKTGFGLGCFFSPQILITLKSSEVNIECGQRNASEIYKEIIEQEIPDLPNKITSIDHALNYEKYADIISKLRHHIKIGDCYEINFCQEFFSHNSMIDPVATYCALSERSPNPFAALYKVDTHYCICGSPERFLKKTGNVVISQPMKGTSSRDHEDPVRDRLNKEYLLGSSKERSENVMIVDLVRNDLSKVCTEGSVQVEELFGVYSFPRVHQMVSTIKGLVKDDLHWTEIIKATFPMGSMTGAPKKRVMELIEQYECTGRGLFSGSIGYVKADGDFDFNVVIRSVFYNSVTGYLSFLTGSGITFYSNPSDEYNECLLKAEAIMEILRR